MFLNATYNQKRPPKSVLSNIIPCNLEFVKIDLTHDFLLTLAINDQINAHPYIIHTVSKLLLVSAANAITLAKAKAKLLTQSFLQPHHYE